MAVLTPEQKLVQRDKEMIPRRLLQAMFALVVVVLVIVTWARITDRPLTAMPPSDVPLLRDKPIVLAGSMSGAARVYDIDGALIADLDENQGGFIAGVWRVLVRERARHGVATDAPIRLVMFADGRMGLRDDLTGWRAELQGFGADNAAAFARLLD